MDLLDGQVDFFQKRSIEMSSGFLRCNQCIETLLLSYQTLPYGNFNFSLFQGGTLTRAIFEKKCRHAKNWSKLKKSKHFLKQ